jgi:two-component sensor histidine kinase
MSTSDRLGLQIVQTMVSIELGGTLAMGANPAGRGAEVSVTIPLR